MAALPVLGRWIKRSVFDGDAIVIALGMSVAETIARISGYYVVAGSQRKRSQNCGCGNVNSMTEKKDEPG